MASLQDLESDLLLQVQVGDGGDYGEPGLGGAALRDDALAVAAVLPVQGVHQVAAVPDAGLPLFRALDQLRGGQHLMAQQCQDLPFHGLQPFGVEHGQGLAEGEPAAQDELQEGGGPYGDAVGRGLDVQVP